MATRTHLISKLSPNSFDLMDYIQEITHLGLAAHLAKQLVNNTDFIVTSAVKTAYKYIKAEVLDVSNCSFVEIADAVKELHLSELAFFEAGSGSQSMIDTVKHLVALREGWVELAIASARLEEGGRSTIANLWNQAENKTYNPPSIEEQLYNPTVRMSQQKKTRVRNSVHKTAKLFGKDEAYAEAKVKSRLEAEAAKNEQLEDQLVQLAPVYVALFDNMLQCDTDVMNQTEVRGEGYSTDGVPSRHLYRGELAFRTLPYNVRALLIEKCSRDADTFRGWQLNRSGITDDEFNFVDMYCDKVMLELQGVLNSPAFKVAAQVEAAGSTV